jgi:hypothetical protein
MESYHGEEGKEGEEGEEEEGEEEVDFLAGYAAQEALAEGRGLFIF